MTKRIFRSILGVSLAVLLASLVLIVGVLHGYFQDRVSGELESLAEYIAHGVEENGTDYLTEDLPTGLPGWMRTAPCSSTTGRTRRRWGTTPSGRRSGRR